LTSALDEAVTR